MQSGPSCSLDSIVRIWRLPVVLEAYVLGYMAAARKVDRAASQAFIPYAWVAFAGLLNAE
jgi:tryptophan-rich sensory protein